MKTNVTNLKLMENNTSNAKAHCSIVIENSVAINDIWIMEGKNGLFVSFPTRPYEDREGEVKYANVVVPISKEARKSLQDAILEAYNAAKEA